jgi:hypothetical protein
MRMNKRERICTAFLGGMPDKVPWTIYRGLLPQDDETEKLQELGLAVVSSAGVYSAERPNVSVSEEKGSPSPQPSPFKGEGVYAKWDENAWVRTYHTPVGNLSQTLKTGGYGSTRTLEHLVKERKDYETLEFFINDTIYRPNYQGFKDADKAYGENGLVWASVERAPFQKLWIEFTGIERLSYDLYDNCDAVERVLDAMLAKQRELWAIVADSPAEFVWCPDNITGEVTGKPHFERYLAPYYEELASVMHKKGKRLVAHMDGRMRRLVECVKKVPVDIIEAFTPPPDGDLPLGEARRAWEDKVISINFPSSIHIAKPEDIRARTLEMLKEVAPGDRIVFGVTENIPGNVLKQSLRTITETINEHGGCPIGNA